MDRKQIDKLQNLLDFIQQDWEKVEQDWGERSYADKINTIFESSVVEGSAMFELLLPVMLREKSKSESPDINTDTALKLLISSCEKSVTVFRHIIATSQNNGSIRFTRRVEVNCPEGKTSFEQVNFTRHSYSAADLPDKEIWFSWEGLNNPFQIKFPKPEFIFDLLEGLPITRLKKCDQCETIFFQKTARKKKYCSDLCKNRHNLELKKVGN